MTLLLIVVLLPLAVIAAAALLSLVVGVAFLFVGNTKLSVLLHLATPRVVVGDPASTTVQATTDTASVVQSAAHIQKDAETGDTIVHMNSQFRHDAVSSIDGRRIVCRI